MPARVPEIRPSTTSGWRVHPLPAPARAGSRKPWQALSKFRAFIQTRAATLAASVSAPSSLRGECWAADFFASGFTGMWEPANARIRACRVERSG